MPKKRITFLIFFLVITLLPFISVNAESMTVNNQEELKNALKNNDIDTIILGSDINTTEKINIGRTVTIDGNNHTIKYTGTFGAKNSPNNTVWGGIYVLQFYRTSGVLKDIKLTGGNAALLLNGSDVKFIGTIDVSGNGFGGIELGQGKDVTEKNKLTVSNDAKIINTSEDDDHPTLWVPNDSESAEVIMNGEEKLIASGEELTMIELNTLFGVPNTFDNINYLFILFFGSLLLTLATVKMNLVKRI